jgi:hypothetical protein
MSSARSLQMRPSTQRTPVSCVAAAIVEASPLARVPASQTVVKPPRSASSAASFADRYTRFSSRQFSSGTQMRR